MNLQLSALAVILGLSISLPVQALPYQVIEDDFNGFSSLQAQGNYIIGTNGIQARIWDRDNLRNRHTFSLAPEQTDQMLPNGKNLSIQHPPSDCHVDFYQGQVISACRHHTGLQFWDPQSGTLLSTLRQVDYSWSPKDQNCSDLNTQYHRVGDIALRTRLQPVLKVWHANKKLYFQANQPSPILQMASSKRWVALLLLDQSLRVYDLKTGLLYWSREAKEAIGGISLDGHRLALSTGEQEIILWDLPSRQQKQLIKLANIKGFQVLKAKQAQAQKAVPQILIGTAANQGLASIGSTVNTGACTQKQSQIDDRPLAFQEMALDKNELFSFFDNKLYALNLDQQSLQHIPLPPQNNYAATVQLQLRFLDGHLFIWSETLDGQKFNFQAYDPSTQVWFQQLPAGFSSSLPDKMFDPSSGEQFDLPSLFQTSDYFPRIEQAGPETPRFSGIAYDTHLSADFTIAQGSDSVVDVWDLKKRELLREIILPDPPKDIEFNHYALALSYQAHDQPSVQLYYPPLYKISQWLDGPPQNSAAYLQTIRLQQDRLLMESRSNKSTFRIWQLPHVPQQPPHALKEITPTGFSSTLTQESYEKQMREQIWPPQTSLPETLHHFSLTGQDIEGWQLTATGLWTLQSSQVKKEMNLYFYSFKQPIQQFVAHLPDFEELLSFEPDELIYKGQKGVYRLEMKSRLLQAYPHSKDLDTTELAGQWLVAEKPHNDDYLWQIWNIEKPQQYKALTTTHLLRLQGEKNDQLYFENTIYQVTNEKERKNFKLDLKQSSLHLEAEPSLRCDPFEMKAGNAYLPWHNWVQSCASLNSENQIEIKTQTTQAHPVFQLDPKYAYSSLNFLTDKWLTLADHTLKRSGSSLIDLEQQQQTHLPGNLESVYSHKQSETLRFSPTNSSLTDQPFAPDKPNQYLTLPQGALHNIKSLTQFETHFFPYGAILIAPDGKYAGWGDYQQYLHFADDSGQMIPWPDAEQRWHKPDQMQQEVQERLSGDAHD